MNSTPSVFELCRLCAVKTATFNRLNIFDNEGKVRNILSKILSCISLEVNENDFMPKVLCVECVNKIESFYEFKMMCLKTDSYLQDLVKQFVPFQQNFYSYEPTRDLNFPDLELGTSRKENDDIICVPPITTAVIESQNKDKTTEQVSKSLFRCHYCKIIFTNRKESLEHLKLMHKKIHKCEVCEDSFRSIEALAEHREKYSKLKESEGLTCRKTNIKRSTKKESKKCQVCGKEYARKYELELHERKHSGIKPYSCTYCDRCFVSTSARNKHIQVHEKRWTHVCNFCGKGFVNKTQYVYHVQKYHTGERPFSCNFCDKRYVRKQDLQMHEINMHNTKPKIVYKCETCSKTFTTKSNLKQHIKIHELPLESRKNFKCNLCDAAFLNNTKLKQHLLIHTGELPYECSICKKRFNSKISLKNHFFVHSGVKEHECEICGKAFSARKSLICHRKTHSGEQIYNCDICQQGFSQRSCLNTHRKSHNTVPITWQMTGS